MARHQGSRWPQAKGQGRGPARGGQHTDEVQAEVLVELVGLLVDEDLQRPARPHHHLLQHRVQHRRAAAPTPPPNAERRRCVWSCEKHFEGSSQYSTRATKWNRVQTGMEWTSDFWIQKIFAKKHAVFLAITTHTDYYWVYKRCLKIEHKAENV